MRCLERSDNKRLILSILNAYRIWVMSMNEVGEIIHMFPKIGVAVVKVTSTLRKGDQIVIKGTGTDFEQVITSMQVDKQEVDEANAGDDIGLKIEEPVRKGDRIFLI